MRLTLTSLSVAMLMITLSGQPGLSRDEIITAATSNLEQEDGSLRTVQQVMIDRGLRGLSVAVFENHQLSWTRSWGIKRAGTRDEVDVETAFSTASISKPIAATLFAKLAEMGLLDLDVPVGNYLKRWSLPENQYTRKIDITLRHLLSHTAGTTQHGSKDFYASDQVPTLVQVLEGGDLPGTQRIKVDFEPGTQWRYSGGSYVIAQLAVEDHMQASLAELAEEFLFRPLRMKHTTGRQPGEPGFPSNAASAHDSEGTVISGGLPICPQTAPSGIWSTPADMTRFLIEMQNALRGAETKVISKAVARLVTTEVRDGFGLGWALFRRFGNRSWFSHGGANTGTGGYVFATLSGGNGITFFGNGPNSVREPILSQLRESIIKAHGWEVRD